MDRIENNDYLPSEHTFPPIRFTYFNSPQLIGITNSTNRLYLLDSGADISYNEVLKNTGVKNDFDL